ncbi:MAG: tetratricopeptide repeat protein [Bacteroidia bacterium]|nr:tetratricopeptide repeat protein [Bacteroidia bacterium]
MILGKYLVKLIFPHPLSFDYSYNQIPNVGVGNWRFLLAFVAYAAMSVYAIMKFKSRDVFAFCILFFFVTVSLVSNVVILIESVFGERFLYVSSLAFCLAAAILLARAFKVDYKKHFYKNFGDLLKHSTAFTAVLAVILTLYSFKTVTRAAQWKNNISLLENDIKASPNSARVHYAYGSAIVIEGALKEEDEVKKQEMLDKGIVHLQRGVEILPTYSDAFFHMGVAYKEKKDYANAIKAFERARLNKTWDDPEFYIASGIAYGSAGQPLKGIEDLNTAIKYKKDAGDEIYNNLGIYYCDAGMYTESLAALNKCIEQDPNNEKAFYNTGNTYAKMNNFTTAINFYAKAIELKPDYTDAYNNTGNSYAQMQNYPKAIEFYNKVIELSPNNTKVLFNIGITHYALKNYPKAIEFFTRVTQIEPGNANAYYNLGNTYRDIGDIANANLNFQKARQLGLNI